MAPDTVLYTLLQIMRKYQANCKGTGKSVRQLKYIKAIQAFRPYFESLNKILAIRFKSVGSQNSQFSMVSHKNTTISHHAVISLPFYLLQ
jgi:hypothetical protein